VPSPEHILENTERIYRPEAGTPQGNLADRAGLPDICGMKLVMAEFSHATQTKAHSRETKYRAKCCGRMAHVSLIANTHPPYPPSIEKNRNLISVGSRSSGRASERSTGRRHKTFESFSPFSFARNLSQRMQYCDHRGKGHEQTL
jgi:hypothetical protein